MAEILHHLGCMKPYKQWDKLPINWCRISAINSINMRYTKCFDGVWYFLSNLLYDAIMIVYFFVFTSNITKDSSLIIYANIF